MLCREWLERGQEEFCLCLFVFFLFRFSSLLDREGVGMHPPRVRGDRYLDRVNAAAIFHYHRW